MIIARQLDLCSNWKPRIVLIFIPSPQNILQTVIDHLLQICLGQFAVDRLGIFALLPMGIFDAIKKSSQSTEGCFDPERILPVVGLACMALRIMSW